MAEESEVCRNFRNNNGNCRYGESCRFQHTEGEPIQVPSKPPGQCFKFGEGETCSKGDTCRFMHGENDPRFDSEGNRDISNEVCNNYKRGRCQFDNCMRKHVEPEPQAEGSGSVGENGRRRRPRERRSRRGPKMCRNFISADGDCPDGDQCRFKHGAEDTRFPDTNEPQQERKPRKKKTKKPRGECFDFRDNGTCDRGDECRFLHGENDTRFAAEESDEKEDNLDERKSTRRRRRTPRGNGGDGGGGGGGNAGPRDLAAISEEECNNYKTGRCRFGDSCRRKHTGEVNPVPVEKIDEICDNFQKNKCRYGDYCRRQHIAADPISS